MIARGFDHYIKKSPSGCWHWTGGINKDGYGIASVARRPKPAHREAYERHHGVELAPRGEPEHRQVDHECHNRSKSCKGGPTCLHRRCVNPGHLILTTAAENSEASPHATAHVNRRKAHCGTCGNDLNGTEVYRYGKSRKCKPCAVRRSREAKRRRAAREGSWAFSH